jgi:hypothetical protein
MSFVWLAKLLFAHLLTDFVLQKRTWVKEKSDKHFLSPFLYLHTFITAIIALLLIGFEYWYIGIIIFITHTIIDGWKSYKPDTIVYFFTDQILHIVVIFICWYLVFYNRSDLKEYIEKVGDNYDFWVTASAFLFLSFPSGIIIGKMTKRWRDALNAPGLEKAGQWIGILERTIILIFLLQNQYAAIGLLITAKGLLRFNEKHKDQQEQKTEYILIGSLISVSFSLITGIFVQYLLR